MNTKGVGLKNISINSSSFYIFTTQNLIRSKQRKGILKKSLESPHSKAWTFRNGFGIVVAMEVIV